jgi:exonuclease III
MGDFNTTPNPSIDRYPIKRQSKSKIMEWLKASIMIDTFRSVNPREVDFTWTNN